MKKTLTFKNISPLFVFGTALVVYSITACRTIAWWDCPRYVLSSVDLGITPPPGSLLLTLLGWIVSKIPVIYPLVFRLNLLAGVMAATTAGILSWLLIRFFSTSHSVAAVRIGA